MESALEQPNGHILIVEDNPDSRAFFRVYLTQENFSVSVAEDAASAFHSVSERRPDLILLDLNLPRTSGFEIARRLHEEPQTAFIPIVVVTALTREVESDPRIAGLPNIRRFIYKPCRPQTLLDAVHNGMALARLRPLNAER